ncbi:MAG: hypothetical protein ACLSUT_04135 [Christensenellales bacterium]|jgi:hypothetical protein
MDLSSILPLLFMNKGNKPDDATATLLKMMTKGEQPAESDILGALLKNQGGSQEMASVLSSALSSKSSKKNKADGFKPVLGFVNNEILGKLTKYMNAQKR